MHVMFRDPQHPDTPLTDWEIFKTEYLPNQIEQIIDRSEIQLPCWFVPLARGVAIPSPDLLRAAGYRAGSRRSKGWYQHHCDVFCKDVGSDGLIVRGYCGQPLWFIEQNGSLGRPHQHSNMALALTFGSTPIATRTYQAATYLAEFCKKNGPPAGLRWIDECPDDMNGAIDFAESRQNDEALVACGSRLAA
jgi:hypothetical protein